MKSQRGFTLVETLVALGMLALLTLGVMTALANQAATNARSEQRTAAAAAAEQTLESLRLDDPELMPSSGVVGPQAVQLNGRQYEVYTRFCAEAQHCADTVRHLQVEVYLNNKKVYDVETIFTELR